MNITKGRLVTALLFPVICLAMLCTYKAVRREMGTDVVIPVTGYDPRDLLSGHYLTYRLDLDPAICEYESRTVGRYVCIRNNADGTVSSRIAVSYDDREGCDALIQGECRAGRFLAGVERFYIPEEHSRDLDRLVRGRRASLSLSVDRNGRAVVKDLLIDGVSWRKSIGPQSR